MDRLGPLVVLLVLAVWFSWISTPENRLDLSRLDLPPPLSRPWLEAAAAGPSMQAPLDPFRLDRFRPEAGEEIPHPDDLLAGLGLPVVFSAGELRFLAWQGSLLAPGQHSGALRVLALDARELVVGVGAERRRFETRRELPLVRGLVVAGEQSAAWIGERMVQVGAGFDGILLVGVGAEGVELEVGGRRFRSCVGEAGLDPRRTS